MEFFIGILVIIYAVAILIAIVKFVVGFLQNLFSDNQQKKQQWRGADLEQNMTSQKEVPLENKRSSEQPEKKNLKKTKKPPATSAKKRTQIPDKTPNTSASQKEFLEHELSFFHMGPWLQKTDKALHTKLCEEFKKKKLTDAIKQISQKQRELMKIMISSLEDSDLVVDHWIVFNVDTKKKQLLKADWDFLSYLSENIDAFDHKQLNEHFSDLQNCHKKYCPDEHQELFFNIKLNNTRLDEQETALEDIVIPSRTLEEYENTELSSELPYYDERPPEIIHPPKECKDKKRLPPGLDPLSEWKEWYKTPNGEQWLAKTKKEIQNSVDYNGDLYKYFPELDSRSNEKKDENLDQNILTPPDQNIIVDKDFDEQLEKRLKKLKKTNHVSSYLVLDGVTKLQQVPSPSSPSRKRSDSDD